MTPARVPALAGLLYLAWSVHADGRALLAARRLDLTPQAQT
jgi:hypothetical protein